jgi:hypothetical protein
MSRSYTHFSCVLPLGRSEFVPPSIALYEQYADELDARYERICFTVKASDADRGCLRIVSGEDGDPEQVIAFVQRCARTFGLTGLWGFHWSQGCAFPSFDAFGGAACLLDLGAQRVVDRIDCRRWLSERIARDKTPAAPLVRPHS